MTGQTVYLLENGNLLHCRAKSESNFTGYTGGGNDGELKEFDWDGNLVWELWYDTDRYIMHHDVQVLPNSNILLLVVEKKSYDECIAAGFNPNVLQQVSERTLTPAYVVEIENTVSSGCKVIWEWHLYIMPRLLNLVSVFLYH